MHQTDEEIIVFLLKGRNRPPVGGRSFTQRRIANESPQLHLKAGARHALIVTNHMRLGRDLGSLLSLLICLLRRRCSRVPGQLLGANFHFQFSTTAV